MGAKKIKHRNNGHHTRDGEQTNGVSFVPHEKLMLARTLLQEVKVDRIEVASARVSDGEKEAVTMICEWARKAGLIDRVEVLGFVDGHTSLDWINDTGCRTINLLSKGSLKHCTQQLKKRRPNSTSATFCKALTMPSNSASTSICIWRTGAAE